LEIYDEVSIAQAVGDVPANAQLDDLAIDATPAVNGISDYGPGHFGVSYTPESYDNAP
jgi:hypothetical protein